MREAHIAVVEQNGVSRTRPLVAPGLVIGRESDCDLVVNYVGASRHHARILVDRSKYYVIDLGSANGTYLADAQLSPDRPYAWLPDVPLRIGDILFYLELG